MYKAITKKQRLEIQKVLYDAVMHHSWKDKKKKMDDLFAEIDLIKKVGGAYAAILVHPKLLHTIVSVYEVLVDKFDNEDTYLTCAYFLLRGIMHIDSKEDK